MDLGEIAKKFDGEIAGGRVVVVIDGKKTYITGRADDGSAYLNDVGVAMRDRMSLQDPPPAAAAKPRGRPRKVAVELGELEIEEE